MSRRIIADRSFKNPHISLRQRAQTLSYRHPRDHTDTALPANEQIILAGRRIAGRRSVAVVVVVMLWFSSISVGQLSSAGTSPLVLKSCGQQGRFQPQNSGGGALPHPPFYHRVRFIRSPKPRKYELHIGLHFCHYSVMGWTMRPVETRPKQPRAGQGSWHGASSPFPISSKMFLKCCKKCFRAVDFPRLCRGRKMVYFTCNHGLTLDISTPAFSFPLRVIVDNDYVRTLMSDIHMTPLVHCC